MAMLLRITRTQLSSLQGEQNLERCGKTKDNEWEDWAAMKIGRYDPANLMLCNATRRGKWG